MKKREKARPQSTRIVSPGRELPVPIRQDILFLLLLVPHFRSELLVLMLADLFLSLFDNTSHDDSFVN